MSNPELPPIHTVRGQRVVLDSDLAALYGVSTIAFNQAIKRNAGRFPSNFAFQLTREQVANLRSQIVISSSETAGSQRPQIVNSKSHGGRRYLPWVFTEHGAIMAAMLLRSEQAVAMSVYVVRAFVQMRDELMTNATILKRLAHGARQRGDGVVKCNGTARERLAGETRRAPFGRRVEQIDKKLLEHDVVLQNIIEKLLPLLNPPPDPPPKRRIGFIVGGD